MPTHMIKSFLLGIAFAALMYGHLPLFFIVGLAVSFYGVSLLLLFFGLYADVLYANDFVLTGSYYFLFTPTFLVIMYVIHIFKKKFLW